MRPLAAFVIAVDGGSLVLSAAGCAGARARQRPDTEQERQRRQSLNDAATEAIESADWPRAQALLTQILDTTPRSAEAHERLGRVLQAQGDVRGAEIEFHRAIALEGEYPEALEGLAAIEARFGR